MLLILKNYSEDNLNLDQIGLGELFESLDIVFFI